MYFKVIMEIKLSCWINVLCTECLFWRSEMKSTVRNEQMNTSTNQLLNVNVYFCHMKKRTHLHNEYFSQQTFEAFAIFKLVRFGHSEEMRLLQYVREYIVILLSFWFLAGTRSQKPLLERPGRLGLLLCCKFSFRSFSCSLFIWILPLSWRGSFQPAHHHFAAGCWLNSLDRAEGFKSTGISNKIWYI